MIASRRQLVPVIGAAPLCDVAFDSGSAGPVDEGEHGRSLLLWKFMRGNLGRRSPPGCDGGHKLRDNR